MTVNRSSAPAEGGPSTSPARKVSLLIADVDGTLVTKEKILTERAQQAVRGLRAAGIAFAITSGRPPRGMSMLIAPLDLTTPIAAFNGGLFVQPDLTILEQHTLPGDVAERVLPTLAAYGLDVWIYRGAQWYLRRRDAPHVDREEWTVKFPPTVVSSFEGVLDDVVKITGVSDDLEAVARCEAETRRQCGPRVSAARSQPYYLDVTHPDANKGTVVRRLSEFLSIPPAEIATIGDMPNDVLMFAKSGLSIAMGNASAEVQQSAHYVTTSYEDEGFANAVERYILGEKERPQ
jgi:Cof subfamily protein (haloacid dehalogenase superfamily)